jgi:radical SAM protein with 4Fe4S-binding SPASM domain
MAKIPRQITQEDLKQFTPIYVVWETTMACDHACLHCGSRAARARPRELSTAENLEVADQLIRLKTREVTLIGGEAYLRPDCEELIAYLHQGGVRVTMQTGGRGIDLDMAGRLKAAGLAAIGVSVDGPPEVHDKLRGLKGSHASAMRALQAARSVGMITTSNSQVNRVNFKSFRETRDILKASGIQVWRLQLTVPMGRAADRPDWILEPYQVLEVLDTLAELQMEEAELAKAKGLSPGKMLDIRLGNNMGYFGPHEELLRSMPGQVSSHWVACRAGRWAMSIESDGTVKPCPSLPTAPYTAGNIRDISLDDLWGAETGGMGAMGFTRDRPIDDLWGFCRTCYYAEICMAGCNFTTHSTMGKRGNNPFCYHRAETLKLQGKRERLVQVERAEGKPYDFGRFEIIEEAWVD